MVQTFKSQRAPDPLAAQHGGTHYKSMGIQPVEFAYVNGYDDCAFSILKYVSRHRNKAGYLDLKKAHHFVELRELLMSKYGACEATDTIPIAEYITSNEIVGAEATILCELHYWACKNHDDGGTAIKNMIVELRDFIYKHED